MGNGTAYRRLLREFATAIRCDLQLQSEGKTVQRATKRRGNAENQQVRPRLGRCGTLLHPMMRSATSLEAAVGLDLLSPSFDHEADWQLGAADVHV
jgi:hypothetical protein